MKKNILFPVFLALVAFVAASCDKDSEGLSRITYYPSVEILGEPEVIINIGETYEDEGCYAELNGEDVSNQIVISSNVNNQRIGIYSINYAAYNEDGFSAVASRTVYVVDPNSVATIYTGEILGRYGAPIFVTDNGDGTYHIDDLMAGYYFYHTYPGYEEAYGYDLHAEADIVIADDNTITQVRGGSWYFSAEVNLDSGIYDPDTKTFHLNVKYGENQILAVTLTAISK